MVYYVFNPFVTYLLSLPRIQLGNLAVPKPETTIRIVTSMVTSKSDRRGNVPNCVVYDHFRQIVPQ
jgi:hypothetical protein